MGFHHDMLLLVVYQYIVVLETTGGMQRGLTPK